MATATPSRRLIHSTAMSPPISPPTIVLPPSRKAGSVQLCSERDRILDQVQEAISKQAAYDSRTEHPRARPCIHRVALAATLATVPIETE